MSTNSPAVVRQAGRGGECARLSGARRSGHRRRPPRPRRQPDRVCRRYKRRVCALSAAAERDWQQCVSHGCGRLRQRDQAGQQHDGLCELRGAAEGLAIGAKAGVDPQLLVDAIKTGSGNSTINEFALPAFLRGETGLGFATALATKDVHLAVELAKECGVPAEVGPLVEQAPDPLSRRRSRRGRHHGYRPRYRAALRRGCERQEVFMTGCSLYSPFGLPLYLGRVESAGLGSITGWTGEFRGLPPQKEGCYGRI